MVPAEFQAYFVANAGAGGALVGLLFVAISLRPERVFGQSASVPHQLRATGAYLALLDAFFISLMALIPGVQLGWPVMILAVLALKNTGSQLFHLVRLHGKVRERITSTTAIITLGSLAIYLAELWCGFLLVRGNSGALYGLCYIIIGSYAVGLSRSWELLGGESLTLLASVFAARQPDAQHAPHGDAAPIPSATTVPAERDATS